MFPTCGRAAQGRLSLSPHASGSMVGMRGVSLGLGVAFMEAEGGVTPRRPLSSCQPRGPVP